VGQTIITILEAVTKLHFYVSCFVIGVCNGARIRGLAPSLKLLLVIVIMASDNLIHGNLAGMQTTYDLIRKIYAQYRLRISGPVVLRGKDQMPVSPLSLSTSYTQQKLHIKDPGSDFR